MPKSTPKSVPHMMPGRVVEQRVRCGRAGCKCARGDLHPAFYRYWTEDGRQRKAYVRRADVAATREACERWAGADAALGALLSSPAAQEQRRQMRATLRSALGPQIGTAAGRRQLRRLR